MFRTFARHPVVGLTAGCCFCNIITRSGGDTLPQISLARFGTIDQEG